MLADHRFARSLTPLLVAVLAGAAQADVTGSFLIGGSTLTADLLDNSGIVTGAGALDAVDLLFATGDLVQTVSPSSFLISGTTTGGVDDPTRGSSMRLDGGFGSSLTSGSGSVGGLTLNLAAGLRLVNDGSGTLISTIVFEIFSDSGDPLAYEIVTTGSAFGSLTAVTGTIFGNGTLSAGAYSVSLSTASDGESDWTMRIVPTPGTAGLALMSLAMVTRRRR